MIGAGSWGEGTEFSLGFEALFLTFFFGFLDAAKQSDNN
jgi:hypothetical protein